MQMPGRKYAQSNSNYRYGFNGKENDKDISEGIQDYGMRIYDRRLVRFLSVDPLTMKYPELTPYQFASNTPIQAIDLDGGEAKYVYGSMNIESRPKLKPTEWYVINGHTNWASFSAACQYNTLTRNSEAFQSIRERNNYYKWADDKAKGNNIYWFGAAKDVTSETMVGAAEAVNLAFMGSSSEKFMSAANKYLFEQNIRNFGPSLVNPRNPITDGTKSFGNLSGAALDNQMVEIEQNQLQTFIDNYKPDFINKNGKEKWTDMVSEINGLFGNSVLRVFTPAANKFAAAEFKLKYGEDAKFDFMNKEHRVFQGQKMAEFLRSQSEDKQETKTAN